MRLRKLSFRPATGQDQVDWQLPNWQAIVKDFDKRHINHRFSETKACSMIFVYILLAAALYLFVFMIIASSKKQPPKKTPAKDSYTDAKEGLFNEDKSKNQSSFYFNAHPALMRSEFVVLDFEMATNAKLSAVSLGLVIFNKGNCEVKEWMFKPYRTKTFMHTDIHGITPEMVADKPQFHEVWNEIHPLLDGKVLIAHNCDFDLPILDTLIDRKVLKPLQPYKYFCTLQYARRFKLNDKYGIKNSLESLARFYKVPYGSHDAAGDSITTLFVLNQLMYERYLDTDKGEKMLLGKKWKRGGSSTTREISIG